MRFSGSRDTDNIFSLNTKGPATNRASLIYNTIFITGKHAQHALQHIQGNELQI